MDGNSVSCEEEEFKLAEKEGVEYILKSDEEKPIKDSEKFIIKGKGFSSEREARKHAKKTVKNSLLWFGMKTAHRVEFEDETRGGGGFTDYGKEKLKESVDEDIRILNDSGLVIYEDVDTKTIFASASAAVRKKTKLESLNREFNKALDYELNSEERTAIELINLSRKEYSKAARFLSLVSAIEIFIERSPEDDNVIDFVENKLRGKPFEFKDEYGLSEKTANSLNSQICQKLEEKSIRKSGRELISEVLGDKEYNEQSAVSFFGDCYDKRSDILHARDESYSLSNNEIRGIRNMAIDLLTAMIQQ